MNVIAEKILQQKERSLRRKVGAINLKMAETAIIVYDATDAKREKEVRTFARFLKEEGIKATTVGFYKKKNKEDKRPEDELNYYYFDKESFNWMGFPKETRLKKIMEEAFHILFDLNLESRFQLRVISTLNKANFKVGRSGGYQNTVCDLTLSIENNKLSYLIEQMKVYLNMINKK